MNTINFTLSFTGILLLSIPLISKSNIINFTSNSMEDEVVVNDSIIHTGCGDCTGGIFIDFIVNNPDYEPINYYWEDQWNNIISSNKDINNLCSGLYHLQIDLKNNQHQTISYTINEIDSLPPEIMTYDLQYYIEENISDDEAINAVTFNEGDTSLFIGLTCQFNESDAKSIIDEIENDFIHGNFISDNCSSNFSVESFSLSYTSDDLANRKIFVKDDAGNTDSLKISIYVDLYYQPRFNELYVDNIDGTSQSYYVNFDFIDEDILLEKNNTYYFDAYVDLVCDGNELELKWDLDSDNNWDQIGEMTFVADEIGSYNIVARATGLDIKNDPYTDLTFTVLVPGISVNDSIIGNSCEGFYDGKIILDIAHFGGDYEPYVIYWEDKYGNILNPEPDGSLLGVTQGTYILYIVLSNNEELTFTYEIPIEDKIPPTIDIYDLSGYIYDNVVDGQGTNADAYVKNDTLLEIGLTCQFDDYLANQLLNDIESKFQEGMFIYDNCSNNFIVESYHIIDDNLVTRKIVVKDQYGNYDSLWIIANIVQYYQPIFEEIYIGYPDNSSEYIGVYNGNIEGNIILSQGETYIFDAYIDPVCIGKTIEVKWDLNNDNIWDHLGVMEYTALEIGYFEIVSEAVGIDINNTSYATLNFAIEVQGISIKDSIINSSCEEKCDGNILLDIQYVGNGFKPMEFIWEDSLGNKLIGEPDGSLLNVCAGKYNLLVKTLYNDSITRIVNVETFDNIKPEVNIKDLDDFLFNSILEERPGGYFFNSIASTLDTVFVGASCSVDFGEASSVFDDIISKINALFFDNCDKELDVESIATYSDSTEFVSTMNNKNISGDLFLASNTIKVIDDSGNETYFTLVIYYDGFHSPVFNTFYIINDFNEPNLIETVPFTIDLNKLSVQYIPESFPIIVTDIDPVCENADLEIRWDIGNDGEFDQLGDSLFINNLKPGKTKLSIVATSTGIRNSQSEVLFDFDINGIVIDYDVLLGCPLECNSIANATIINYGMDFEVINSEWIDLNSQDVIGFNNEIENLCFDQYLFKISLIDGSLIIDTIDINFDAFVNIENEVCLGDNSGSLQLINYTKTINEFPFGWYDAEDNLVSNDSIVSGLESGIYRLIVGDITSACKYEKSFEIQAGSESPQAVFTVSSTGEDNSILIENNSQNANQFIWDFGNGESANFGESVFNYQYDSEGDFTITLISINELNCSDTTMQTISVSEITGLNKNMIVPSIYPNPCNGVVIVNGNFENRNIYLQVFDLNGHRIIENYLINRTNQELDLTYLISGVYFLRFRENDKYYTYKLIKN